VPMRKSNVRAGTCQLDTDAEESAGKPADSPTLATGDVRADGIRVSCGNNRGSVLDSVLRGKREGLSCRPELGSPLTHEARRTRMAEVHSAIFRPFRDEATDSSVYHLVRSCFSELRERAWCAGTVRVSLSHSGQLGLKPRTFA